MREDRDRQLLQVQELQAEVAKYKEFTGKYSADMETLNTKAVELEVCFPIECFLVEAWSFLFSGFFFLFFFADKMLSSK